MAKIASISVTQFTVQVISSVAQQVADGWVGAQFFSDPSNPAASLKSLAEVYEFKAFILDRAEERTRKAADHAQVVATHSCGEGR